MDCKKALQDSGGDIEKAVEYLRKRGIAVAAKKASRIAAEGIIADLSTDDGGFHALVEVNCETDFVAKTDDFQKYAASAAKLVLNEKPRDLDALMNLKLSGKRVLDFQNELVAKIGENIRIRRFETLARGAKEKIAKYIHPGSKIASLVLFSDPADRLSDQLAREVAMHVAAMNPQFIGKEDVPEDYISKEKEIFAEQMAGEKKPPEIMEKIIFGKLAKHLSEVCLEDQIFVKDPEGKNSIKKTLQKVDSGIKIKKFIRLQVGEGIEGKK